MTVTIKRIGGSVGVVIPKAVARDMQLTEGTALQITASGDAIVMRRDKRRPRRSLRKIVAAIDSASYRRRNRNLARDRAVGREIA